MQFAIITGIATGLVVLYFFLSGLARANPARVALVLRRIVAALCFAAAVFLAVRGALPIAIPVFLFGLGLLGTNPLSGGFPWGSKSAGQKSKVATRILSMELDHDTGEVDGEVLVGEFAGRRLGELGLPDLVRLLESCRAETDQSAALLEAYIDRRFPDWRAGEAGGQGQRGNGGGAAGATAGGRMSREEAYSVLGLKSGASPEEIRAAHRRLMKTCHPDHGGSDYLAAKINQAKDVLMGH